MAWFGLKGLLCRPLLVTISSVGFCRMAMEGFTEELGHEHGFEEAPGFD